MPRKSLAEERSAQILQAFETCIAKFGIEGSTLEKIAEEAQMKRTIIRHYIGNRDELVQAVADRLVARLQERLATFRAAAIADAASLEDFVFERYAELSYVDVLLIEQFIASAETYPQQSAAMVDYVSQFTEVLTLKLIEVAKGGSTEKNWQVAYGITAILFNEASLQPLKLGKKYTTAARHCVAVLIASLKNI